MSATEGDDWLTRALRPLAEEPGSDTEAAMASFREGLARMHSDPEYAAYIESLADDLDLDDGASPQKTQAPKPARGNPDD